MCSLLVTKFSTLLCSYLCFNCAQNIVYLISLLLFNHCPKPHYYPRKVLLILGIVWYYCGELI